MFIDIPKLTSKKRKSVMSVIRNIMILATTGHHIYTYRSEYDALKNHDDLLMNGLISAMKSFANSFEGEELESINMTKSKIVLLPSMINKIVIALICDYEDNLDMCYQALETIRDEIFSNYLNQLKGLNLTCIPEETKEKIKEIIEKVLKKVRKN